MKYNATLFNRWFSCPCMDYVDMLTPCGECPATLEDARNIAESMGYTPTMSDDDDVDPVAGIVVNIKPTCNGAEYAWIWFYSV